LRLKTAAVSGSSRRSAGRELHTDGPATEKARSANLVLMAAGGRVATVGQLLFAAWAWVYSILHPFGVGKSSTGLSAWG